MGSFADRFDVFRIRGLFMTASPLCGDPLINRPSPAKGGSAFAGLGKENTGPE
jgi:hypothetical protein